MPAEYAAYTSTFIALWVVLLTIVVQALVAVRTHRKQSKVIPGVLDSNLGHDSFVFRSDRAFRNSLENIAPLFGLATIAVLAGFDPMRLSIAVWVYALARILHSILYYAIATEKNPSPRSYFYLIGLIATLYLLVDLGVFLIL